MRGRKPKPISQHKLEGTYDASRHRRRQAEPKADGDLAEMKPPARLSKAQQALWRAVLKRAPKTVLQVADYDAVTEYVDLLDRYERAIAAQAVIDAHNPDLPLLMRGANGIPVMSPYIRIIDRSLASLLRLQSELGLTPVSRARLGRPEELPAPGADDRWGELKRFPVLPGGKAR
jgi:P27 family predicted phage terminase small subunit